MKSSSFLIFALAFAVFFVGPALLSTELPGYELMKLGDAFDLLTPLVLVPLYWRMWNAALDRPASDRTTTAFLILAALWVLGHGMHLAANSIGHQLEEFSNSNAYQLTRFYDEGLSHYLWHLGIFGLTGLILLAAWRGSAASLARPDVVLIGAGAVYGLMVFIIVIEAQTGPIGIPFAVLFVGWIWSARFRRLSATQAEWFFGLAHFLALILFAGWWLYWGYLPEFSELGWI